MHVLIATDGSDDATDAAVAGLALLKGAAKVTVACVAHPPALMSSGMESGFAGGTATREELDSAWEGSRLEAKTAIDQTVAALPDGAVAETAIPEGDPGAALCHLAEELGVDALVVGSRGRGAFKRALLGSVSSYVTHNAPCPVVIIRSGVE